MKIWLAFCSTSALYCCWMHPASHSNQGDDEGGKNSLFLNLWCRWISDNFFFLALVTLQQSSLTVCKEVSKDFIEGLKQLQQPVKLFPPALSSKKSCQLHPFFFLHYSDSAKLKLQLGRPPSWSLKWPVNESGSRCCSRAKCTHSLTVSALNSELISWLLPISPWGSGALLTHP